MKIALEESSVGYNEERGACEREQVWGWLKTRVVVLRKNKVLQKNVESWRKSEESSGRVTWVSKPMRKMVCLIYISGLATTVEMCTLSTLALHVEGGRSYMPFACFELRSSVPTNAQ